MRKYIPKLKEKLMEALEAEIEICRYSEYDDAYSCVVLGHILRNHGYDSEEADNVVRQYGNLFAPHEESRGNGAWLFLAFTAQKYDDYVDEKNEWRRTALSLFADIYEDTNRSMAEVTYRV